MAARRCSLGQRSASCDRCARERRSCGVPAGRAGEDPGLRRHSCGLFVRGAGTDTSRNRGECWTPRRVTRFPPRVPRSHTAPRASARRRRAGPGRCGGGRHPLRSRRQAAGPRSRRSIPSVAAWTRGDDRGAAALTSDPRAAAAALAANRRGLDGARARARGDGVDRATTAPARPCSCAGRAGSGRGRTARASGCSAPTALEGRLDAGRRPSAPDRRPAPGHGARPRGARAERRPEGRPLVSPRAASCASGSTGPRSRTSRRRRRRWRPSSTSTRPARARRPPRRPQQIVEAVTLRAADYPPTLDAQVEAIRAPRSCGHRRSSRRPEFARALLGAVGPATAEQIKRSRARSASATRWASAASRRASRTSSPARRRAGSSSARAAVRRSDAAEAAAAARAAAAHHPRPGRAAGRRGRARRHARRRRRWWRVQPSTGDILAVANRPTDAAYDRAIEGRYPPGSTFKVVTTAALLRDGAEDERHRRLPEDDHRRRQAVPELRGRGRRRRAVRRDFAQSCNTAFVSLAKRLAPDALTGAGARLRPGAHRREPGPRAGPRRGRARGDDDRPGPHRRQPAGHGRRRGDRRRRALARAAPGRRPTSKRRARRSTDGELVDPADPHAQRRHLGYRHRARRAFPARGRQERDRRVRRRQPAAHARLVHRLPRRPRRRRARREGAARAARSPRRSPARFFQALGPGG